VLIVFDVGNSETTVGVFDGETLRATWRIMTDVPRTADEYTVLLRALLAGRSLDPGAVRAASIASVVPRVTQPLSEACRDGLGLDRITLVDGGSALPIRLAVDEPLSVGADRIVNTLAASRLYGRDAIVVDLGTATTFDCITADGVFLGGVIAPGVRMQLESLVRRTSKLPATELVLPKRVIGTRTEECIRAGVIFGAADAIDGTVRRIKDEWPTADVPMVIGTGGLAETFAALCEELETVKPDLTLQGLRLAHEHLTAAR
jgi:type III pantothenate kinase